MVTAGAGGGGATPVPASETEWGLPGASSVIEREACLEPGVAGWKVTLTEQNVFGWRTLGGWQVSDLAKSAASGPPMEMVLMVRDWAPLLVRVSICAGLVELVETLPKDSEFVEEQWRDRRRLAGREGR